MVRIAGGMFEVAGRFRLPEALPPLEGWCAVIYSILWMPLLAVSLWLAAGSAWYGIVDGAGDAYTWHALGIDDNTVIDRVAGDEARRAGVRNGDRILAFDGIVMPQGETSDAQDWRIKKHLLAARGPVTVELQHGKDPPRSVTLTRTVAHGNSLYAGTGLTPATLSWLGTLANLLAPVTLIVGACLLFTRRRDPVAALLSVALLGWTGGAPYAHYYLIRFDAAWLLIVLSFVGVSCLLLTLLLFPNGRFVPRWSLWVMAALPPVIAVGF